MPRGVIDLEALRSAEVQALKNTEIPTGMPFNITKIGHVVIKVRDLEHSAAFYTGVLGFRVSDAYPDSMIPGGMVFMPCRTMRSSVNSS